MNRNKKIPGLGAVGTLILLGTLTTLLVYNPEFTKTAGGSQ